MNRGGRGMAARNQSEAQILEQIKKFEDDDKGIDRSKNGWTMETTLAYFIETNLLACMAEFRVLGEAL